MDAVQSREDYLENILILSKKKGQVRNVDIALQMNYSRPSVSVAVKKLDQAAAKGLLHKNNVARKKSALVSKLNKAQ